MLEQVRDRPPLQFDVLHHGFEIGGVPQYDGPGDQIERAGAMSLRLQAVGASMAGTVEKDRAFQGILRLSVV